MLVTLIAAKNWNNCIGINNQIPWDVKEDLAWFKKATLGKPVIMGRKTYESIGKPLPGRRIIVISRTLPPTEGVEVYCSLQNALLKLMAQNLAAGLLSSTSTSDEGPRDDDGYSLDEVMIAGGGEIYQQAIKVADRMLITEVPCNVIGDVFFPDIGDEWEWNSKTLLTYWSGSRNLPVTMTEYFREKVRPMG